MPTITRKDTLANALRSANLMVTHTPNGDEYGTTLGQSVSARLARNLVQYDMFTVPPDDSLIPNNDGLFPGFSQTFRAA